MHGLACIEPKVLHHESMKAKIKKHKCKSNADDITSDGGAHLAN